MQELKILATGIGSMPFKDVASALDLVFQHTPHIPYWPQLPKRDVREGMITQFSENLPSKEKELEKFYEKIIEQDIDYFKISQDYALGLHAFKKRLQDNPDLLKDIEFIKCQVTGPFTFAASIKDDKEVALLHDSVFMQAISKGLTMKALWQINYFKEFAKKMLVFIDEPYLGCFGSAYTAINREDVVKVLSEFTTTIKSEDILLGVHCCGNTDWSIFTQINSMALISFDAFAFQDRFILYADNLRSFLKRGGIICWGIVPTQDFSGKETSEGLLERLSAGINALVKKGIEKDLLLSNILISPACGLGSLDTKKAEAVSRLLSQLSFLIRKSVL